MDEKLAVSDDMEFMTAKQAARYLNVSVACVYRLCGAKKLTHYKFGEGRGALRIRRDDLLDLIQDCRIEKREREIRIDQRRRPVKQQERVYKHLDLRPEHVCGATTAAGTPCKRRTKDEHCPQHST